MDLNRMQLFLDVVEAGGIARAATLRGCPQSQVSRQIAALEREYGVRLMHRTGRGLVLTEHAAELVPRIRALLAEASSIEGELRREQLVPRGEVRIGLLPSFIEPLAARFLLAVQDELPGVQLKLLEGASGQLEEWLATGRVDVGMVVRKQGSTPGDFVENAEIAMHVIGPADSAALAAPTIRFSDMRRLPLVLPAQPSAVRSLLDQVARQESLALKIALETDSYLAQLQLASAGVAFAVLGSYAVRGSVGRGIVRASRLVEPELRRPIGLAMTTARPATVASREAARLLRRMVHAVTQEVDGGPPQSRRIVTFGNSPSNSLDAIE